MSDSSDDSYAEHHAEQSRARALMQRTLSRPRSLLRKLLVGDAIGERPETGVPRALRRRR